MHLTFEISATKQTVKLTPPTPRKKYLLVSAKILRISTVMAATALIPVANSTAPPFPCFMTTRARRKLFLRNSLVIATAEDQSSTDSPPPESVARRLILLRHATSSWENRSLRGILYWKLGQFMFIGVLHSDNSTFRVENVVPIVISVRL